MKIANHIYVGKLGEDIACRFLEDQEFYIKERNYKKKWGELDIVALRKDVIHFFEVKTVSREIRNSDRDDNAAHEARLFQPEDSVHPLKRRRLARAIQSYLSERNVLEKAEWRFGILAVFVDIERRTARVRQTQEIPLF